MSDNREPLTPEKYAEIHNVAQPGEGQNFTPEYIARKLQDTSTRLAPAYGFVPVVPDQEQVMALLTATIKSLMDEGIISPGNEHVMMQKKLISKLPSGTITVSGFFPPSTYGEVFIEIDEDFYIHGETIMCRLKHEGTGAIVGRWTENMSKEDVNGVLSDHDRAYHEGPGGE